MTGQFAHTTIAGVGAAGLATAISAARELPCANIALLDGRLGGFNFQWAWVGGRVAARGLIAAIAGDRAAGSV